VKARKNSMVETIKIFLNKETLISLEDHFENTENQTLHRFFYEQLRELAKTSKLSDTNRSFNANVFDENGAMVQKSFKYVDVDLEKFVLKSDLDWRPKDLEEDDIGVFEMKVGEKTHNHLSNYCKIHAARTAKFNESLPKIDGKIDPRYKEVPEPACFEEIIHLALYQPIINLLQQSAQELFDRENDEIEKAEAEAEEKAKSQK
jgi:hypothetical protein